jgi:hypothetical protein
MTTNKTKCKCKVCGNYYNLYTREVPLTPNGFTVVKYFFIEDEKDPSKNKQGIAVTHCAKG